MTRAEKVVGILETGRPPPELAATYGDYPAMMRHWLQDLPASFTSFAVLDGDFPERPDQAALWLITGSRFGAYEDHAWIRPLEDFIRRCRDEDGRMLGICFGHQIIAQALGGVVRKSEKGWGLGIHEYAVNDAWPAILGPAPEKIAIQAVHQDQVIEKPAQAVTIAGSDFCPFGALWYPGFALTVQGHPEFAANFARALIAARRGTVFSDTDAEMGLKQVDHADNRMLLAQRAECLLRL